MISDELNNLNPFSKAKSTKKNKNKNKKKNKDDDDEKEDEETQKDTEAKKMDKIFIKGKNNFTLTSRRDNFSECVKLRFLRKVKPVDIQELKGGFDYIA